jgi:tetratricopeptide (TPR) repeat protein
MMNNSLLRSLVFSTLVLAVPGSAVGEHILSSTKEGPRGLEKQVAAEFSPSLDTEIIYNILVGEIALQRQNFDLAYKHQLKSADLAKDAVAAERAAKIALYQKDRVGALKAIKSWIDFDPKSVNARQMAVMLYVQMGDSEAALRHLKLLVKLLEDDDQDGFVQAVVAVASGKDNELALKIMQSLVLDYKSNANARYAVALIAVMAKKLDVAENEIQQSIKIDPKLEKAHILLGRIYGERGDLVGAMNAMRQALEQVPESTALHSAYARLLIDLNKPKLAYQQFQRLSELVPDDVDVKLSLGIIALQLEKYKQATNYFNTLIQLKKRVDDASFYMGRIAEAENKQKVALEWYGKVADGKNLINAKARIVGLVAEQDGLEKARSMLSDMRSKMPESLIDLYIVEGSILRKHSTHDEVVELFDAALKEFPDNIDLLYARALSASALGRLEVMERDIRFILKHEPDHADALNALGYTLADQTDRYNEALGYIKKALAIKPGSPAILDSMGWVQYRLGNHEEALQYLRRAFDMVQDVEIAAHLGELLWVTGKKQEALKVIREALDKHPDNKYLLKTVKRLGI